MSAEVTRKSTERAAGDGRGQDWRGKVRGPKLETPRCVGPVFVLKDSLDKHISLLLLCDYVEVGLIVERGKVYRLARKGGGGRETVGGGIYCQIPFL